MSVCVYVCVCVYLYMCVFVLKDLLRIHDFMEAGMKLDYGISKKCHGAHVLESLY